MQISLCIFVVLDVVKVIVFRYWSFELTASLWPTPKRRKKLALRKREVENNRKIQHNISKLRKVLIMIRVIKVLRNEKANGGNNENNTEQ